MTISSFAGMTTKGQMEYLKQSAILIHRIVKGNVIVSLYWSKEFIFEVLNPTNNQKNYEIKCYERFKYVHS